jgi:BioD-like phosphotransacetylase family protein
MRSLYVTSVQSFSGKTAICLGLGRRMQADGFKVGYFKPLGTELRQVGMRLYHDEDTLFTSQVLNLSEPPQVLAPVCLTPDLIKEQLAGSTQDLMTLIIEAYNIARQDKDVLVLEGGASLREGYAVGLATGKVARMLGVPVIAVIKYDSDLHIVDDALATQAWLGDQLIGVVINHVPPTRLAFATEVAAPALERRRISVFGVLRQEEHLVATTAGEIVQAAEGQILCRRDKRDELVENLRVGAMSVEETRTRLADNLPLNVVSADEARTRLGRVPNKAVITASDYTEMIAIALETGAKLILLTGKQEPDQNQLQRAVNLGIPVATVPHDTLRTIDRIERLFGKSGLTQAASLVRLETLMDRYFDFKRLYERLGLIPGQPVS